MVPAQDPKSPLHPSFSQNPVLKFNSHYSFHSHSYHHQNHCPSQAIASNASNSPPIINSNVSLPPLYSILAGLYLPTNPPPPQHPRRWASDHSHPLKLHVENHLPQRSSCNSLQTQQSLLHSSHSLHDIPPHRIQYHARPTDVSGAMLWVRVAGTMCCCAVGSECYA